MTVSYLVGDTREIVSQIPDASVDLIACSPPFLALRSYLSADHADKHREIGSEPSPAAFLDTLLELTAEWGRVLAPHGSIAIELGDTYSGSGGAGGDYGPTGLRNGQATFDRSAKRTRTHNLYAASPRGNYNEGGANTTGEPMPGVPITGGPGWPRPKSLALIPQLYAVALAYGLNPLTGQPSPAGQWLVRNVIVWHRPNPAVGALGDKVRPSTSYIVIATRSAKRWFDLTAVRTAFTGHGGSPQRIHAYAEPRTDRNDWNAERLSNTHAGAPPLDAWFDEYDGTEDNAVAEAPSHDTWTLTTQPSPLAHYAMWPARLAERLVLMMCPFAVCRICGEPQRRVEGAAEYVNNGGRPINHDMTAFPRVATGVKQFKTTGDNSAHRTAPTLGWSDCGHECPSCFGIGWRMDSAGWDPCPDCGGNALIDLAGTGRPFRPGHTLDPFAGTGTTLAVADLHHRDATGIDLDPRNADIYPARYLEVKRALYGTPAEMPGQMGLFG